MPTLILVRHGQSQFNLENRFTGWLDVPLTDQGKAEARSAGRKLSGYKFHMAFTSALQRAQETLTLILTEIHQLEIPVIKNAALNERHYGDLQGLNKAETAQKFGDHQVKIWRRSYDVPPPNGESLKDTAARTIPYFQKEIIPQLKSGKDILIVAHGNSLRSIVMELDHLSKEQVLELNLETGVPRVYQMDVNLNVLSFSNLD
jgi:2,3-bisphosphoglycerate-dependent phosphoglycerate mutase